MAKEVVEMEKVVTEKETVTVCNDCGREVDEDGESLSNRRTSLDLCSDCLDRLAGSPNEPGYIERASEWADTTPYRGWNHSFEEVLVSAGTSFALGGGAMFALIAASMFLKTGAAPWIGFFVTLGMVVSGVGLRYVFKTASEVA